MFDWWKYIEKDLESLWYSLSFSDLQYPFAFILWIIIIRMQLLGVDRRDIITGICYTLFCAATGVTLFLALPGTAKNISAFGLHLTLISLFSGVAAYRWFHAGEQLLVVSTDASKNKNNRQDLDHEKN